MSVGTGFFVAVNVMKLASDSVNGIINGLNKENGCTCK
jgi:hypothetical protein